MTTTLPQATSTAKPKWCSPGDSNLATDHSVIDAQSGGVGGDSTTRNGHHAAETQGSRAVSGQTTPAPTGCPTPIGKAAPGSDFTSSHAGFDDQRDAAAGGSAPETGHEFDETHRCVAGLGPILADPTLAIAADVVDDLERVRCANENRLRQLTATGEHGHGMSPDDPNIIRLSVLTGAIHDLEKDAIKNLEKVMRAHPLWEWAEPITGLGAKQFARLLQSIRDPYWNDLHARPRTVNQLWAYCGQHVVHPADHGCRASQEVTVGGVAPKRQRGQKSNWNEDARKRCHLIAESLIKEPGRTWPAPDEPATRHYRRVYEQTRDKYADATHTTECVRCGPKGKPALPGSPLSAGHQHARALRKVAKELLKDLWQEAKRIHNEENQ